MAEHSESPRLLVQKFREKARANISRMDGAEAELHPPVEPEIDPEAVESPEKPREQNPMGTIHRLQFDAYRVGDRLLDGVSFAVSLRIKGLSAEILSVEPWDEADASFLESINFEHFKALTVKQLQSDIDYLAEFYRKDGLSFEEGMAEFEEETGEPGVQVFVEV